MRKKRADIYKSWGHVLVTMVFVVAPFVFILFFSRFANVAVGGLLFNTGISLSRMIIAYFVSAVLGWVAAAAFYRGRRANVALPIFDVLQSIPTFAALPLAVFYWGATNFTVIFFLVLAIIWPVFFSVISSLKLIKHDWEEAVEVSGLNGWDYVSGFLWPVSLPALITGSIIGLGDGWEALIATEIITEIKTGLGGFFQSFSTNPEITFFGILGFLVLIFCINKLIWLPLLNWSHKLLEE